MLCLAAKVIRGGSYIIYTLLYFFLLFLLFFSLFSFATFLFSLFFSFFFVFLFSWVKPLPTPVEPDLERQIKPYTALKTLADFLIACNFLICLSPYLFARNLRGNLFTHNRRGDFNWERRRYIKIFQAFIGWKAPSIMRDRRVQLGLAVACSS